MDFPELQNLIINNDIDEEKLWEQLGVKPEHLTCELPKLTKKEDKKKLNAAENNQGGKSEVNSVKNDQIKAENSLVANDHKSEVQVIENQTVINQFLPFAEKSNNNIENTKVKKAELESIIAEIKPEEHLVCDLAEKPKQLEINEDDLNQLLIDLYTQELLGLEHDNKTPLIIPNFLHIGNLLD